MTVTNRPKIPSELEDVQRQLRGFDNLASWMLESDEKEELKRLEKREKELLCK